MKWYTVPCEVSDLYIWENSTWGNIFLDHNRRGRWVVQRLLATPSMALSRTSTFNGLSVTSLPDLAMFIAGTVRWNGHEMPPQTMVKCTTMGEYGQLWPQVSTCLEALCAGKLEAQQLLTCSTGWAELREVSSGEAQAFRPISGEDLYGPKFLHLLSSRNTEIIDHGICWAKREKRQNGVAVGQTSKEDEEIFQE